MQVIAIRRPSTSGGLRLLEQMHRLRARIFAGRLGWAVDCTDGEERDEFDQLEPTYILALDAGGDVVGCARLLPATGPTMLQSVFPQLLHESPLRPHSHMIESSRFCVDTAANPERHGRLVHEATITLFAGIIEWCLVNQYTEIATATDIRLERLLNRSGWPFRRLGTPVLINETLSVGGVLAADRSILERLRSPGYISDFHYSETRSG